MELYRMFGNKKLWMLFLACIGAACIQLAVSEYHTVQYRYGGSVKYMQKQNETAQAEYFLNWEDKVSKIVNGSDDVVRIFQKEGGFVSDNRKKTVEVYKRISNCKLAMGKDELVTAVVNNQISGVLCLGFLIIVIFALLEDRKCNLWGILYAGKEGREKLGFKKICSLFFWCVIVNFFLLGSQVLYTCVYYDIKKEDWIRSIQSIMMESDCVFSIQVWQYFIYYFFVTTISYFLISLFIYVILQLFRTRKLGLFFLVLFVGVEYMFYRLIEVQSNMVLLKYINIFSFLFPEQIVFHYNNINLFEHACSRLWVMEIAAAVLFFLFFLSSVLLSCCMKPFHTKGDLEQIIIKGTAFMKEKWYKIQYKLSMAGLELYRLLIMQRGLLFLIVISFIMIRMISFQPGFYDAKTQFKEEYYEKFHGSLKQEAYDYLLDKENELSNLKTHYKIALQQYRESKIDYEQLQSEKLYVEQQMLYKEAIEELKQEYVQLRDHRKQNRHVVIVNQNSYERIFGKNSEYDKILMTFLLLTVMLVSSFDYFSSDSKKGIRFVMKAAKNGRSNYVHYKFRAILRANIIYLILLSFIRAVSIFCQYAPKDLSASFSSVFLCENYPINLSIAQFFILLTGCRLASMMAISSIILLCSETVGGGKGAFMTMIVIGVEEIIIAKLGDAGIFSLVQGLSGIRLSYLVSVWELFAYLGLCITIYVFARIYVTKHWNEK